MVQRFVSGWFSSSGENDPLYKGPDFRYFTGEIAESPAVSLPPDSVPAVRFTRMPEQDLAIWTVADVFSVFARAVTGVLRPAELQTIPIRENDHA
jgi:hypothetical protein